ncbi:MAG TPA: hypothetical protein VFT12_12675 [Thermoanaerobaculia bacterium]|nr:hypothetical protein [Thermoanaerobaculia bacterium]
MSETWSQRCLERGTSILLASVDGKGVPTCCRAIAVNSTDGFKTLTVYVPVATSREIIANVASSRRMAVSVTQPLSHSSVQLKGTTTGIRLARDDEHDFVETRLLDFGDILYEIGLPRKITRSIAHWPAFAIDVNVEQVYEQTPGPNAGNPMTA